MFRCFFFFKLKRVLIFCGVDFHSLNSNYRFFYFFSFIARETIMNQPLVPFAGKTPERVDEAGRVEPLYNILANNWIQKISWEKGSEVCSNRPNECKIKTCCEALTVADVL